MSGSLHIDGPLVVGAVGAVVVTTVDDHDRGIRHRGGLIADRDAHGERLRRHIASPREPGRATVLRTNRANSVIVRAGGQRQGRNTDSAQVKDLHDWSP